MNRFSTKVKVLQNPAMTVEERKFAIELSHLIGFHSVSYRFPAMVNLEDQESADLCFVIGGEGTGEKLVEDGFAVYRAGKCVYVSLQGHAADAYRWISEHYGELLGIDLYPRRCRKEGFVSATDTPHPLNPRYDRKEAGLESLFERDFLLKDTDLDVLPDRLDAGMLCCGCESDRVLDAMCTVALRLGMELTAIHYPLVCESDEGGNLLRFAEAESSSVSIAKEKERTVVDFACGSDAEEFFCRFAEQFPDVKEERTVLQCTEQLKDSLCLKNLDGQMAKLKSLGEEAKGAVCGFAPKVEEKLEELQKRWSETRFEKSIGLEEVCRKEFDLPWEVDVALEKIKGIVPELSKGDQVELFACLSEDQAERAAFVEKVKELLLGSGAELTKAETVNAYKQGFSWLEEIITPKLQGKPVARMTVQFKPFLQPGVTDWGDVDGATPSYSSTGGDPNRWFDLPLRYLQELFPVDDIIAPKLGISRDDIEMVTYDGDEDITYLVCAYDAEGNELLQETYKAACDERPYLNEFPEMGLVHPSTGYVKVRVNGREVLNERVRTDLETIWDTYQSEVLPYIRGVADARCNGEPSADMQPFFAQLRLDISVSEEERALGVRQDLFSPLNALHEDIYFVGIDMFKVYGAHTNGSNLDAPGLFLPMIEKVSGKPSFAMTHYKQKFDGAVIEKNGVNLAGDVVRGDLAVTVEKITAEDHGLALHFAVESEKDVAETVRAFVELCGEGATEFAHLLSGYASLSIRVGDAVYTAKLPDEPEQVKDLSINDVEIYERELIGYEQYLKVIEQLKRVPGILVYRAGETYQGRDIYAIRMMPEYEGYLSRTKLISQNPTELINARHHANEVSGTNGVFMILKRLLTDEAYAGLANEMNLIFIPFENADGAAIHYELQKQAPSWTYHIARYNSLGKEFYRDYYDVDTIHTEALVIRDTYYRWLPDVFTDNHGVPCHEWEQQFSGYTSPWFKGFWLPRSLLYGYFWYICEPEYADNEVLNRQWGDAIADRLLVDEEIQSVNADWRNRHEKYAHKWMPKLFPADYYKNMINYWVKSGYNPNHGYMAVRYPWITSISFTSEVLDETAQDDHLFLCARTQALHMIAGIDFIRGAGCVYDETIEGKEGTVRSVGIRKRPIISAGLLT